MEAVFIVQAHATLIKSPYTSQCIPIADSDVHPHRGPNPRILSITADDRSICAWRLEFEQSTKKRIGLSTDFSSTISSDSEPGTI